MKLKFVKGRTVYQKLCGLICLIFIPHQTNYAPYTYTYTPYTYTYTPYNIHYTLKTDWVASCCLIFIPHQTTIHTLVMPLILYAVTNGLETFTTRISYFYSQSNLNLEIVKLFVFHYIGYKIRFQVLDLSICG